ncbi:hypothetical protein [Dinghuibacter silviterrae]|uniref:Glycosyl hydrolase family 20 n=1 Tax=Dinghuibacter silviterrae TaxID=1539049 RepID=A0A4V3GLY4_9BACT|nr:hypothetical protein [Dinghuibacter silviterrae]TDX01373.1 hypothetical protein EDB95_2407 [Dinghuibacter silviterrae]
MKKIFAYIVCCVLTCPVVGQGAARPRVLLPAAPRVVLPPNAAPRVHYGAARLTAALKAAGVQRPVVLILRKGLPQEGFLIESKNGRVEVTASDASGLLYGCMELADTVAARKGLPAKIHVSDHPEMPFRATCIGLQKPTLLPGRGAYEYPYTPENFRWFYDRALWLRYLDSMANNRMNALCLWNGHPFASLVRVKAYPYAVEVPDSILEKNRALFKFLTAEADKRGIWVIQTFYNIIVSQPFAKANHLKTQDRNRHIIPLIADYTRKSIAAFVEQYPNTGLMFTLGEAMEGVGQDDIDWLTKTIIPGVLDGLHALGRTDLPPLVLRAHDTDAPADLRAALPLYAHLYTEAKFNGEALTTYTPRGSWAELHRTLSRMAPIQIENVHIMANLEPFRYGSADFIQRCVQAMHAVYGAKGLHLYPQASYWDWPYSADSVGGGAPAARLLEMDRDWIWYRAWARYAWNCHRDSAAETAYWSTLLGTRFGCGTDGGAAILAAYNASGIIAPELLRRVGITDGNRQTLTLGMFMDQLIDPNRFGLFSLLYESEAPPGESLAQYAARDWAHENHEGETPVSVADDVIRAGREAVEAIDRAAPAVTRQHPEFKRLSNDMRAYRALADFYADKIEAALHVLRYTYSGDLADLDSAVAPLTASVRAFDTLNDLTRGTYRYANSMQTAQRKIPIRGADGTYKTWAEMLPLYQMERERFIKNLDSLHTARTQKPPQVEPLRAAAVTVQGDTFTLAPGSRVFSDTNVVIQDLAVPLRGLRGVRLPFGGDTSVRFTSTRPVKVLVGYFVTHDKAFLQEPQLETDASANDFGQADIRLAGALLVPGLPVVNVHAFAYPAGTHTLSLGKGACLVLGFIDGDQVFSAYDAGLHSPGAVNVDWLFDK